MTGWHHWPNGHEFEQALGFGDGQGSMACCSPWGRKELDTTEWLNWTEYQCFKLTAFMDLNLGVSNLNWLFVEFCKAY